MTNRRANYPPVPKDRHEARKTRPFAFHRTPMSAAVEAAMKELRARRREDRQPHPAQPPAPWPWSWYEALRRGFAALRRRWKGR